MATIDTQIVEPYPVADIFATGMTQTENVAQGFIRLTFFSEQVTAYDNEAHPLCQERAVVARIVIPLRNYLRLLALSLERRENERIH